MRTYLWIPPNSVFIYASMMHLKTIILRIFIEKSWFGWVTNYKKMYQKANFSQSRDSNFQKFLSGANCCGASGRSYKQITYCPFFSLDLPPKNSGFVFISQYSAVLIMKVSKKFSGHTEQSTVMQFVTFSFRNFYYYLWIPSRILFFIHT